MGEKSLESQLAARLRAEREARGWSLGDLSAKSGVSRAMASKIEREEASPTASLLGRMSAAFGLTLSELFAAKEPDTGQLSRREDQLAWRDPETGFTRRALSPLGDKSLDLTWCELPRGAEVAYPSGAFMAIEDQQLILLEGKLRIQQGEQNFDLLPHDCFRFNSPSPTVFRNPGRQTSRYIVATTRRRQPTAIGGGRRSTQEKEHLAKFLSEKSAGLHKQSKE